jgi:hypothetical protein
MKERTKKPKTAFRHPLLSQEEEKRARFLVQVQEHQTVIALIDGG